jgi:periplasmic protein TonB
MLDNRPERVYWAFGAGSVVVHLVLAFVVFFVEPMRHEDLKAQPVELVSLPSGVLDPLAPILPEPVPEPAEAAAEPPPAEEPPPPPPPEPPKPEPPKPDELQEPNQVKNVKKKPTPAPTSRPRPTAKLMPTVVSAPAPASTPAPAPERKFAMRQRRGVPNGFETSGAMSFDNESFNFAYYGTSLEAKLSNNFIPPPNAFVQGRVFETTVYFVIGKNGELLESRVDKPSGFGQLDEAALRAVIVSVPFPPLPVGFRGMELGVSLRFRCGQM